MTHHHFGVYARISTADRILLIHKTRGPYAGLLDLPGGRPEDGEAWHEALERELHEELGVRVSVAGEFVPFSFHLPAPIDFHHSGVFVDLPPVVPHLTQSPDTAGHEWFNLGTGDPSRLSTLVRVVLGE